MDKVTKTILLLIVLSLLPGCADRQLGQLPSRQPGNSLSQSSGSESGEEPPADPGPQPQQPDLTEYNDRYIMAISLYRLDDFEAPEDIPPEAWVSYYLMAAYDGPGKLPIPEGYRNQTDFSLLIPGDEVEDFLTGHFELEADYLQKAQGYVKSSHSYGFGPMGLSGAALAQVTNLQQQGSELSIIFDVYLGMGEQEPDLSGDPVATRIAAFTLDEDGAGFVVRSLKTLYQADLDRLLNQPLPDAAG